MPDTQAPPSTAIADGDKDADFYEISAVARLTGLSTHNLRVWEKRHQVVEPVRSPSKRRLYSRDDVRKLGLLKALVDRGQSIGSLARLDVDQLEQRLSDDEKGSAGAPGKTRRDHQLGRRCRIAIAGPFIRASFGEDGPLSDQFRLVSEHANLDDLRDSLRPGSVDVIILEVATLFDDQIEAIQKLLTSLRAKRAVVSYRFAPEKAIARIEADLPAISTLRSPANATELRLACLSGMSLEDGADDALTLPPLPDLAETAQNAPDDGGIPSRTYTDAEIAGAAKLSGSVKCECPQHLANLVISLVAFEQYSEECENRNADDARLHAYLHRAAASARASMETALTAVLRAEDLELPAEEN